MIIRPPFVLLLLAVFRFAAADEAVVVDTTAELVAAVQSASGGTTVETAAGTYKLGAPLQPRAGVTLKGLAWVKRSSRMKTIGSRRPAHFPTRKFV